MQLTDATETKFVNLRVLEELHQVYEDGSCSNKSFWKCQGRHCPWVAFPLCQSAEQSQEQWQRRRKRLRNLDVKQFASTTAGLLQMVLPRLFCHQKVVQKLKQNHRELSASKYGITELAEHNWWKWVCGRFSCSYLLSHLIVHKPFGSTHCGKTIFLIQKVDYG